MARIDAKHVTPARVLVEPEEALTVQASCITMCGVVVVVRASTVAREVIGVEPEGDREDIRIQVSLKGSSRMAGRRAPPGTANLAGGERRAAASFGARLARSGVEGVIERPVLAGLGFGSRFLERAHVGLDAGYRGLDLGDLGADVHTVEGQAAGGGNGGAVVRVHAGT